MAEPLYDLVLECPWCGSPTEVLADCSAGAQPLAEDCRVCCSPILIQIECDPMTGELLSLTGVREKSQEGDRPMTTEAASSGWPPRTQATN